MRFAILYLLVFFVFRQTLRSFVHKSDDKVALKQTFNLAKVTVTGQIYIQVIFFHLGQLLTT